MAARDHGLSKTRAYAAWSAMHRRCDGRDPRSPQYIAKGITVCPRWFDFLNFLTDMGHPPAGLTLERKDNSKGYHPGNCVWATQGEQVNNRDVTTRLTANGETKTLADWAKLQGISQTVIKKRLRLGWSEQDAVMKPLRCGGYKKAA